MAFSSMFSAPDAEREKQKAIYRELGFFEEMYIAMSRQLKATWGAWIVARIQHIKEQREILKRKYQF